MTTAPNDARTGEFTGRHMLLIMFAFFGVIVAVNVTMAVLAGRTWTGLVVKNSYVASQKFNSELAAAKVQHARGWQSSLTYRDGVISFTLVDRDGQPVIYDDLMVHYGRPAFEQADRTVAFKHAGSGHYRVSAPLTAGYWSIRVSGGAGNKAYRRDSRLLVSSNAKSGREQ